jgi:hypothetical protein
MEAADAVQHSQSHPPQRLNRVLYCLIIASFFLPFATVRSCTGDEGGGVSYTGIELLTEEAGALLIGVLLLAGLFLALSFRRRVFAVIQQGLLSATKALLCGIAILTTFFATSMTFMFSRVNLQMGFFVCVGSWLALEHLSLRAALHDYSLARNECREKPPPWALVVGALAVLAFVLTAWQSEPDGAAEVAFGLFTGILVGVPFVVLAMLLAVWSKCRDYGAIAHE